MKRALAVLCLFTLTACTVNQINVALELVVAATGVATSVIEAIPNLDPATHDAAVKYLQDVVRVVPDIQTELNSTENNAQKVTGIIGKIAAITIPVLPGAPPALNIGIQGVIAALKVFEATLQAHLSQPGVAVASTKVNVTPAVVKAAAVNKRLERHVMAGHLKKR